MVRPRKASAKELGVYHNRDYLDYVLDPNAGADEEGNEGERVRGSFGLEHVRFLASSDNDID